MGRRRGFFAELQHQQRLAEQRHRREQAAAVQAYNRAVREHERAVRDHVRAVAAAERASQVERAIAEARALEAHQAARKAEAESRTAQAVDAFEQIDMLLGATLDVDDFVDIDSLKQTATHPPFPREDLRVPVPAPQLLQPPPEPVFVPPQAPTGLSKVFGKQRYAADYEAAKAEWSEQHQHWAHYVQYSLPARNQEILEAHAVAERKRASELAAASADYEAECAERERDVARANEQLDAFKESLAAGHPDAVNEYVGIVLGNSAYPEAFQVDHEFEFDAELRELTVAVIVPAPTDMPRVKAYRYIAKSDELRETPCAQKEQRDRYNRAVAAVAIRTFHEVFEGDRDRRIQTISLTVQTETVNPATGLPETFPLIAAAADREEFARFDLQNVDPEQTLTYMRAAISKNAFGLKSISTARGVR